ncbi:PDZ domain-containing protein [Streptomyces sp. J2-1]|uniref:S41 family peptidase n=1 Tax=Streptomyces corallincola TaxID=2851888 RepID=UPI001C381F3A|nr:S41 family peptidase [Streptomyces corallincola]MBV2354347.1 PDZ domain-containing protein [Streptomyces corallincola]
MSGRDPFCPQPRRQRRGAALTLAFVGVLVAGAATASFPETAFSADESPKPAAGSGRSALGQVDVRRAAAAAMAAGTSPVEAAERAVSRSGDRWAAVYSEGEYQEFRESLDGRYTGVGLSARRTERGQVEVSAVRPGSPAARAGVRTGDRLRTVDGTAVDGRPVTDVVALLRGDAQDAPAGTAVTLGLRRGTHDWTETLRRARLTTDPVTERRLPGGATVVRVSAFTKGTGADVRRAVRRAPSGAGIVLDLRGNSGGLVTEATAAASAFLDGGLVATYDVDGAQRVLHAAPGGDTDRALVVLVDGGTMSAAEMLTGALQDRGRAVVIGSRTFGKGSVQMPTTLPDGSVAELTVGHYRTPAGRAVDGRGITPDLEAGSAALDHALTVLTGLGTRAEDR